MTTDRPKFGDVYLGRDGATAMVVHQTLSALDDNALCLIMLSPDWDREGTIITVPIYSKYWEMADDQPETA